ncbi:hypothetical protein F5141DRAFT_1216565 [Pisolithus sp. B1]|nr:hypothetical protein F5141DRAFT_1216565 [Pisolithus sp. B1]
MFLQPARRSTALRRPTARLVSLRRFVSDFSSVEDDRNELRKIMNDEADKAEAQEAAIDPKISWQQKGIRRKFSPGLFIRPHYWSHEHRFEKQRLFTSQPLVALGNREARERDALRHFGIDPFYETSNTTLLASFITEMGKTKSRIETKLTTKTQRRLGKAIRRAKMMGILPQLSNPRIAPRQSSRVTLPRLS